ncbi:predicted protein [Naegleria gruberi]|uniref:Predicted protein n=1 Tax=Naegleria gruberi TaxID=5762 RepID=D2VIX4_NAEGR|nr:uncharacterized protein NAEGRDRAFT_68832 [Naegleria gruberi]EFC43177.1 predicted protein [Naegleria gruberi]|eukprot:XP_002675921.1 predicted protein [Naegleria gruberi strain NEG-M]
MERINEVVNLFRINNGPYHMRVKQLQAEFKVRQFDFQDAKEKFINYHTQHFLHPKSQTRIETSPNMITKKPKSNQSRPDKGAIVTIGESSDVQFKSISQIVDEECFEELGGQM